MEVKSNREEKVLAVRDIELRRYRLQRPATLTARPKLVMHSQISLFTPMIDLQSTKAKEGMKPSQVEKIGFDAEKRAWLSLGSKVRENCQTFT